MGEERRGWRRVASEGGVARAKRGKRMVSNREQHGEQVNAVASGRLRGAWAPLWPAGEWNTSHGQGHQPVNMTRVRAAPYWCCCTNGLPHRDQSSRRPACVVHDPVAVWSSTTPQRPVLLVRAWLLLTFARICKRSPLMIAPLSTTNTSNAGFPNPSLGRLGPPCVAQPSLSTESDVIWRVRLPCLLSLCPASTPCLYARLTRSFKMTRSRFKTN